jgi:uncharacterized membrane protein
VKSRAAIKGHPLHPALVAIPIGAWFATLVGDIAYMRSADLFWYDFSYVAMSIGVIGALVAALPGLVDFFSVKMSEAGLSVAKIHMALNLSIVAAYGVNLWIRHLHMALSTVDPMRWQLAFWLQIVSFAALGVSGWLGGELTFRHKVGVAEGVDEEATAIGAGERTRVLTPRDRAIS